MSHPPKLWRYPRTFKESILMVLGFVIFWIIVFPLWMIFVRDIFVYINAQAMFYNPWVIWDEYNEGW